MQALMLWSLHVYLHSAHPLATVGGWDSEKYAGLSLIGSQFIGEFPKVHKGNSQCDFLGL